MSSIRKKTTEKKTLGVMTVLVFWSANKKIDHQKSRCRPMSCDLLECVRKGKKKGRGATMSDKSIDHPANGSKEREIELGGVVASLRRHATHGWLACPLPSTHTRTKHTKRIAVLIPKVGHFYIAFLSMKKNLFFSSSLLQKDRTYKYIGDTHTQSFAPKKGNPCTAVALSTWPFIPRK